MDQAIRNKLRSVVTQCRRLLEESIAQQLQGRYDIYATGKKDEVRAEKDVPLDHLGDEERQARKDILAHFEHITALGYKPREALEQLIREIAFTHLNRLCAYKMMEVRDVYVGGQRFREAVSKGLKSQGFLFYLADHPEDERRFNAGQQEEAYRHFLNWLGGTLSQEIGVLFSPTDPANRVYPPQRVLDEVLDLLNSEELKGVWSEDETIGWVYQYFTPKELRDQARKESQAPRNSYELAFRNQFFTPRYVVEFLTDNTLGRIWYEMRQGRTRLADECRYMVRRPDEVFLARMSSPDEEYPQEACVEAARLLSEGDEASFPPFDESEGSVQRMIDMAHVVSAYDRHGDEVFGWDLDGARHVERMGELSTQFILDLLFANCRADRQAGTGEVYGQPWFVAMANEVRRRALAARGSDLKTEEQLRLPVFVPYRAKKDPREIKVLDPACGSGHFLLYGFALLLVIYEEAYDDPELGPGLQGEYATKDDLRKAIPSLILRHNLHGIDIDLRCTQIAALALWLRCQRAYQEIGLKKDRPLITRSNIVCAEPMPGEKYMLHEFVAQVEPKLLGHLVEVVFEKMKLAGEVGSLLKIEKEIHDVVSGARKQWIAGPSATQMRLFDEQNSVVRQQRFDLSGITDTQFFEQAEAKVVDALRRYSQQAQGGLRLQRTLFSDDAVQGFAFVEYCHKRFDVVLMNPPFGDPSGPSLNYMHSAYPDTKHDLYSAFVEHGVSLLAERGILGAITSRTGFYLSSAEDWRRHTLLGRATPTVVADLGYGVLDTAKVETAAYCLQESTSRTSKAPSWFFRLLAEPRKDESLLNSVLAVNGDRPHEDNQFVLYAHAFDEIPTAPFAYWTDQTFRAIYRNLQAFSNDDRTVKQGLATADDFRFVRTWWEVSPLSIVTGDRTTTAAEFRQMTFTGKRWVPFAKGGEYCPFFSDVDLLVNWERDGEEIKSYRDEATGKTRSRPQNTAYYFRPGLTYLSRTSLRLCSTALPRGSIFSHVAPAIFVPDAELHCALARFNSFAAEYLLSCFHARGTEGDDQTKKYEVGLISSLPWPVVTTEQHRQPVQKLVAQLVSLAASDEVSHWFATPTSRREAGLDSVVQGVRAVEEIIGGEYGLELARILKPETQTIANDAAIAAEIAHGLKVSLFNQRETASSKDLVSYSLGCILGRWDTRLAVLPEAETPCPDPFDPLPVCSTGMLQGPDGLPATKAPDGYPLRILWDGILVDDPDHPDDIIRRVRDALEVVWMDRADAIEKEACEILGVADLRDYFRKPGPGGFWDDHIKRYSRSRRKAPIYWLLQSSKKNYALWVYYHRLDKDILFKALLNHVEPKIRKEEARLGELRSQKAALGPAAKGAKKLDKDIDRQEAFLSELRDFEDKLRRAASLHLDPDLNDGVVLNIAPLHELVRWKEAKSYWDDLMDGKYEWSSIAKQLREKGLVP